MAAPSKAQLVAMLTAGGQTDTARWLQAPTQNWLDWSAWGKPAAAGATTTPLGLGNRGMDPATIAALFSGAGAVNPLAPATQPSTQELIANGRLGITWDGRQWRAPGQPAAGGGLVPGGLNVPYGSDYFAPTLDSWTRLQLAGLQDRQFGRTLGQQQGQFTTEALMNAAQALAGLYAQGPRSAAELAFANSGMGFPAIGGNAAAIEALIRSSTLGASAPAANLNLGGGQAVSVPSTLGGQALARLQADPNLAGVIASFAKAAGNPDLLARSGAAALPAGFFEPRYGRPVLPGMGL